MSNMKRSKLFILCLAVVGASFAVSCSDDDSGGGVDAAVQHDAAVNDAALTDGQIPDSTTADGGFEHSLKIVVVGDQTPVTIEDGYSGQTPANYFIGLQRFDLMKSENDQDPVTVFDYGNDYVEVDMLSTTQVAEVDILTIPVAIYTHGRVLLTMTRFDVDTTVHVNMPPTVLDGTTSVVAALSDTVIDGTSRSQGWAEYTFNVMGGITRPGSLPDMPSTGGGTIVQESGRTWMVFPLSSNITIIPIPNKSYTATITYQVFESFRWEDQDEIGYAEGVFDCVDDGTTEPLRNFGATDYEVVVE